MKTKILLAFSLILLLCNTCSKDDKPSLEELIAIEALDEDQAAFWDNQPSVNLTTSEVILPNGLSLDDYLLQMAPDFYYDWNKKSTEATNELGPQDSKNLLIAKLSQIAIYLTTRSNFVYTGSNESQPDQNGLAYSFGSRDHTVRKKPPFGDCTYEIYGLDCSGMIYQLFLQSGVTSGLYSSAEIQRQPATLQKAIKTAFPELKKIKVEDLGKIETSKVESGDIIYWLDSKGVAFHIGMILKNSTGNLLVAQSNGRASVDCEDNYGPNRGPRFVNVNSAVLPPKTGFGSDYRIVRINAEISGKWDLVIRCQNASYDFLTVNLEFPTKNSNNFQLSKTAVYPGDGVSYDLDFSFTYDNVTNILTCMFSTNASVYPDFYRFDSFSVKLERDDTGYFAATLGDHYNSGCAYDVRLINKEVSSVKSALLSGMRLN
ncbi:MAG TPA: NlpC/P60 family protein [Bacteroidales bacterium]|nr:NlpC/P60 family protein [Bacteroidales bacterium]